MYNAKAYSAASATSPLALPRSRGAIRRKTTFRSRSSSAASATPTFIRLATSGATSCRPSIRACRVTRSSAVSPRSAPPSPNSSRATWRRSAAWSIPTAPARMPGRSGTVLPELDSHLQLSRTSISDGVTYGGYSDSIVVDENFVLHVPDNLDLAGVAPLLCAGITTYSPMRHWGVGQGKKVGVVGLGGLGHMGVKFAHAFGAHVVVFTTSPRARRKTRSASARMRSSSRRMPTRWRSTPAASTSFSTLSPPITTSTPIINLLAPRRQPDAGRSARETARGRCLRPDHGPPQPLRLADRRHRRDAGDARLLRRAQHHRRRRSHPDPEGQRSLRADCSSPM